MEKHGLGTPRLGLISSRSWLARIRSNGKGKPSIRQAKASADRACRSRAENTGAHGTLGGRARTDREGARQAGTVLAWNSGHDQEAGHGCEGSEAEYKPHNVSNSHCPDCGTRLLEKKTKRGKRLSARVTIADTSVQARSACQSPLSAVPQEDGDERRQGGAVRAVSGAALRKR